MVALYRYNGKLLFKNGGFATHERCCCDDDCPCDGCSHCPDHCIDWTFVTISWTGCSCGYLEFQYPGTGCDEPDCPENQGCNVAPHNARSCRWIDECTWELHGRWTCMGEFATHTECGTLLVEALSPTQFRFTPGVFTGSSNCRLECQTTLAGDPVTLDVTCLSSPSMTTICESVITPIPFGPNASANTTCGSSPLGCFDSAEVQWSATDCCPTDSSESGGSGESGGGGGSDPLGCCTNADYTTTPDQTQADCEAAGGYWQQGDCDEGYP